jgi:NADH-quinone oxidoreductase subunit N
MAIAGVVISIYYYFGWIRAAYFSDEAAIDPEIRKRVAGGGLALRVALAALAAASVVLGFYQGPLGRLVSGH